MRRFHSYGPVDAELHFCVPRTELVEQCVDTIIGDPDKGGHYFTIWAPRQTGKTWLMRQAKQEIVRRYGDRFTVFNFSLGNLRGMNYGLPTEPGLPPFPDGLGDVLEHSLPGQPRVETWDDFLVVFSRDHGLWDRSLILFIDEADTAPPILLDLIVGKFREMYLSRETNWLHGLALIGVRAVLGIESQRGSPFNVQRSLHVPNLTEAEVQSLFQQYQEESGQQIAAEVVEAVYTTTRGQPGLVSWFGELLTEKYNPGPSQMIGRTVWERVYQKACYAEFNNTVLNLINKAKTIYRRHVLELFSRADVIFSLDADWCNYMYLHGLIDQDDVLTSSGHPMTICRFASPFIQLRIYNALTYDLFDDYVPILALEPLDELEDVFDKAVLDLQALLQRYRHYLTRLKAKGINPWKEQPRRETDAQLTEAVGHFHLYAWLKDVVGKRCIVSPEFPTGNGKVDIHLKCGDKQGIIEVKSFVDAYQLKLDRVKAAQYAQSLGLDRVTMAIFIPVVDEAVLAKLSGEEMLEGVRVVVVAIGWA